MKSIVFTWLFLSAFLLSPVLAVAQAPLMYGVGLDNDVPKKINLVSPGGPGEKAGLVIGDLVVAINGVPTKGLANKAIIDLLSKKNDASVTVTHNGVKKTVKLTKMPMDSFGRICLSGNCGNGQGRLKMVNYASREYEGMFVNGTPTGEIKIYHRNGDLYYTGNVKVFFPDGRGKTYEKDNTGGVSVIEEGDFLSGYLVNGIKFNADGSFLSAGQYEAGTEGKLISEYMTGNFHGKTCNYKCTGIRRGPKGALMNGKLIITEPDGAARKLFQAYYTNGVLDGVAQMWDYDEGMLYSIIYKNGTARTDGANGASITRIADNSLVALEVRFSTGADKKFDWPTRIEYGAFNFGNGRRYISSPSGGTTLSAFKGLYNGGKGDPFYGKVDPVSPQPGVGGTEPLSYATKNAINQAVEILKQCDASLKKIKDISDGMTKKTYTQGRDEIERMLRRMISDFEAFLEYYKNDLPRKDYNLIERRLHEIQAISVPSYVQYH